jgi:hypothetical protein
MHGAYAVLLRWTGDSEPEVTTEAAVEEGSRGTGYHGLLVLPARHPC